eukprot:Plantae.Rhodophyta-Hildenbrandia_rubra.ctg1514.p1 GENE.Plantae.Rhodophyta-Hildenbrandia_rubra.ctg1514~~Plantae.Rhodophyta-Hildenbrandia_rubra.ctg1514.p1  ORF type:complete len:483 (+),score=54.65 Plantae.Rhodophyta-Hildenbrandia_rubra.ctg1514:2566-4014(+)
MTDESIGRSDSSSSDESGLSETERANLSQQEPAKRKSERKSNEPVDWSHWARMVSGKGSTSGVQFDSPDDLRCILTDMISDPTLKPLCDVTLIVGNERFPAHKAVLAASSRVFRAMFTNNMKERSMVEVTLNDVDPKSWQIALQYIYTAHVEFDDAETALLALSSARMYNLENLEKFVENFLISKLCVDNCFDFLAHADHYTLMELSKSCNDLFEKSFEDVSKSSGFLCCSKELLVQLLQSKNLVIKSELTVFNAVIRWVEASCVERAQMLESIMEMVDIGELTEAELACVSRNATALKSRYVQSALFNNLLAYTESDLDMDGLLATGSHLKLRKRSERPFTFWHQLRNVTSTVPNDDEEVVRTPWRKDLTGKQVWRLKIYPKGYAKAKGEYLSMYVQARSQFKDDPLDLHARFDIFLVNRKHPTSTISFSSQHHFTTNSDHWGFHRYIPLSRLGDAKEGFLEELTDSVLLGANVLFSTTEK